MTRTTDRVGFLVDDASLPNIVTQLRLLGDELAAAFELDLFYHESVDSSLESVYTTHRVPVEDATVVPSSTVSQIIARIAGFSAVGSRYVEAHSPVALVGFTNPPVLGTAAGVAAFGTATQGVYRYSGDSFSEYRQLRGLSRILGLCHYNGLGRLALSLCDTYVVLGEHGRTELADRSVPEQQIYTIPPTVDRQLFSAGESSTLSTSERQVGLYVGRLTRRKGADRLERIVDGVLDASDAIEFMIVGDGPFRQRFEQFSGDRIHVAGQVPHTDLPEYYRAADFLVHPSRLEGLPNVLLEAAATGLRSVTTPVGEMEAYADYTCDSVPEFVTTIVELPTHDPEPRDECLPPDLQATGRAFREMLREQRR